MTLKESDVPIAGRVLTVSGRVSAETRDVVHNGLPSCRPRRSEILFAQFAYADLPIGKIFECCFMLDNPEEKKLAPIEVVAVTQQFGKPFDEIPHGWKTIVLAGFLSEVPAMVAGLPAIQDWYDEPPTIGLSSADTWRELVQRMRA